MDRVPYSLNFEVIIQAVVEVCNVKLLGFKIRQFSVKYAIGDKGFAYELPEVVQDPKCGILIKEFTFEATET